MMENTAFIKRQIESIAHKNFLELKEKFQELHGFDCGDTNSRNLRKRIAYRLQEIFKGGITDTDRSILGDIADRDPIANLKIAATRRVTKQRGAKYFRIWKGKTYEVTVGDHGQFVYDGDAFKSLSAVARKITGTRWNGKVFFGVKDYAKEK